MSMMSATSEAKEIQPSLPPTSQVFVQVQEVQPLVCKDLDGLEEEYMLQLQHEETHILQAIPSKIAPVGQEDTSVVENNIVKVDCLDPKPSRRCPIRHLALQQYKLPLIMLIPEHEEYFYKEELVYLSHNEGIPMLERKFFVISTREEVSHAEIFLLCLLLFLAAHMHGRKNHLVRKGNYFNKPVNHFF